MSILNLYKTVKEPRRHIVWRLTAERDACAARARRLCDERGHDAAHAADIERTLRGIAADYASLPLLVERIAVVLPKADA